MGTGYRAGSREWRLEIVNYNYYIVCIVTTFWFETGVESDEINLKHIFQYSNKPFTNYPIFSVFCHY